MEKVLKGICIFPDINQINNFSSKDYIPEEWDPYVLSNGRILNVPGKLHRTVIFDFDGGDYDWSGYVRGFIYPDGKYLGTMHYVSESGVIPEKLNGTYNVIENGIELKGFWYNSEDNKLGFFIKLTSESLDKAISSEIGGNPVKQESKAIRKNRTKPKPPAETYSEILTAELYDRLAQKAKKVKQKSKSGIYDHYQHVIGLKLQPSSFDDLLIAMSVAYSWMPTMLDIYLTDKKTKNKLLKATKSLGSITTLQEFENNEEVIKEWLEELTKVVNHSIVGVSKTLHIFFPKSIPIIDSRVLKAWENIFKKHYNKHPKLKLPISIPADSNRMINTYIHYWKLLLLWNRNIKNKDIRKLEEPLYWLGKGLQGKY